MSLYAILSEDKSKVKSIADFDPSLVIKSGYYLPVIDMNSPQNSFYTASYTISPTSVSRTYIPDYIGYRNYLTSQLDVRLQQEVLTALTGASSLDRDDLIDRLISGRANLLNQLNKSPDIALMAQDSGIRTFIPPTTLTGQYSIVNSVSTTGAYLINLVNFLSGSLPLTYQTIVKNNNSLNSLSGFTVNTIGALQALIAAGGSVVNITGSNPIATVSLTGIGGTLIFSSGGQVFVSGSVGGVAASDLALTGQLAWNTANDNAINLSGNITSTGSVLTNTQNLLSGLMLSGTLERKPQFSINYSTTSVTWTSMPAAANYFNATALYTSFADLTYYTGVQLIFSKLATAGAASGSLFLRYSSNPAQTFSNFLDIDTATSRLQVNVANVMINSGFFPLVAGAKSGVYIALCGSGGNGVLSPIFGMVSANFK